MKTYNRNEYGQLYPVGGQKFEVWDAATALVFRAAKKGKIPRAWDGISFDRKGRSDGGAVHHEIYDVLPSPLTVLVCVRETEGSKYGVRTVSKTYYTIKRHGKNGTSVAEANKSKAAKAAKNADCELGCAIAVVTGRKKLQLSRACPDGIAYKSLAVDDSGRLVSIYDGSPWVLGQERFDRALRDHNGGLYVYETLESARYAEVPESSACYHLPRVVVKCHVSGNYCRYGKKLAFSRVTPINVEVSDDNR